MTGSRYYLISLLLYLTWIKIIILFEYTKMQI